MLYGPGFAQGGNGPMGAFFPGITDANRKFHKNVLIGGNAARYSNYATASQNFFPNANGSVQFVNFSNGINNYRDYALAGTSPYKHAASDGRHRRGLRPTRQRVACAGKPASRRCPCPPNPSTRKSACIPIRSATTSPWPAPCPLEDAVLVLFSATGQEVRRFSKLNGLAVVVATGDLPPGIYFAALWQAEQVLARRVIAVAK
ncbi:MAG: hypothetical protein IPM98_17785 [Lewinellaceae bacterium]|nr:hypothetical protein [Lewinellaceae bacterium]